MKLRNLLKGTNTHQTLNGPLRGTEQVVSATIPPRPTERPAPPPVASGAVGQCTATTKSGNQCKMPAVRGTDRCTLPSHQKM